MNNEKMISAILNDIEYGIRETEKMIRDIDTEFKKLNDNLAINKQTEKKEVSEKIYILTEGDYSDYAIKGVFLDKAEAERLAKKFEYRLEEYENGKLEDDVDGFEYFVDITKSGKLADISEFPMSSKNVSKRINFSNPDHSTLEETMSVIFFMKDKDDDKAIKIASDIWSVIIANSLWGKEKEANIIFRG